MKQPTINRIAMNRSTVTQYLRRRLDELPPDAAWTFAIRIVAVGVEFSCLLVLARVFPAKAYGIYVLVMSCIAIGAVPATVGFDRLLVREIAAYRAANDWARLKGLLRRGAQIAFGASIVVVVAILAGAVLFVEPADADMARAMQLGVVLIPILAFARLRQATLQGFGHMVAGQLPEAIVQPGIMILLTVITAAFLPVSRSAGLALVLQVIAAGSALALGFILLRRHLPAGIAAVAATFRTREWLAAGATFMWLVGMSAILTNADTILVGALIGPAEAGVYRVASQLAMFVGLPLTAVSVAMAPSISALHATGRLDELRERARMAARSVLIGAIGIAAGIGVFGPYVLAAFGPEFARAYVPSMILVGAYVIHSAMATASYLLFMTAHERTAMFIFTAGIVVNVIGNLLLIPEYGMAGAAIATGSSLCLVAVTCALLVWRLIGINATVFSTIGTRDEK